MARGEFGSGSTRGRWFHLTVRVGVAYLVPAGAPLFGFSAGRVGWLLSSLLAGTEVFFAVHKVYFKRSEGKGRSLKPKGFFPLALVGIYMVQLWWMMLHAAAAPSEASKVQVRAESLNLEPSLEAAIPESSGGGKPAPGLRGARREEQVVADAVVSPPPPPPPPVIQRPLAAGPGPNFKLDESPEKLSWEAKTISVVLPCAEEREYALKTVQSVFQSTPAEVLHEIVVVDDGSNPPLSTTHLKPDVQEKYKTKVLRHEQTVGLIGAKKTGGDAATGDVVVFFDCHVAPQNDWWRPFITQISENYRRMVVPMITALNVDTWTQQSSGGMAKCYLTWDADFKWFDSDDNYIAVISGGLLGMSNRWWRETGGYDKEMLGWGGENLDQSLRVWLCGGEIVMAPESQVAHMWRDGSAKTSARYQHVGDTGRNRARAAYGWYGEFSQKLMHYPAFANRHSPEGGLPWYGDLSTFEELKHELAGCRPFAWFLRRFKKVYEDGGIVPPEIFLLQETKSQKCLFFLGYAGTSGSGKEGVELRDCDERNDRFYWHLGNADPITSKCCSGLRAWNTDQCLNGGQGGGRGITGICSVNGRDSGQHWKLEEDGHLRRGGQCIGLKPGTQKDLHETACSYFSGDDDSKWVKIHAREPLETTLYNKALHDHPEVFSNLLGMQNR